MNYNIALKAKYNITDMISKISNRLEKIKEHGSYPRMERQSTDLSTT